MRRTTILLAILAVAMAGLFSTAGASHSARAADDPNALLDQLTTKLNAHDGAGAAALFSEDGIFSDLSGTSFAGVGVPAIAAVFSDVSGIAAAGDPAFNVTLVSGDVAGNTVTGVANIRSSFTIAAGVERYVQPYTATVSGGKITRLHLTYDESDAQTLTYLHYEASLPDTTVPAADRVTVTMSGNQNGTASLETQADGVAFVIIKIDAGPYGVLQPASIYSGSCAALGSVSFPLAVVPYGASYTYVSGNFQDWIDGDFAIAVGDSSDNPGVIVSCADIEAVQAAPTPTPAAGGGVQLPNTGSGGATGMDLSWLIAALALGGVGLAGAGALALKRR